jgi:hypothetical protein
MQYAYINKGTFLYIRHFVFLRIFFIEFGDHDTNLRVIIYVDEHLDIPRDVQIQT